MAAPAIRLNDGAMIPQLGLGVFQVPARETARVVAEALAIGYRHVDTAQMYGNEAGVGEAVAASGLARDEVFVTTKLNNGNHRPDDARRSFARSLETLGLDDVDVFLIHWPRARQAPDGYVAAWGVLEELARDGRARSIGVSNFEVEHLERLAAEADVVPAVNQVELHPYFQNREVAAWGAGHGVVTEAWAPIARGAVLGDPVVAEVAASRGRTPAQVVLRWHLQHGLVVFPKSSSPARLRENFDVFDFELSAEEMARIDRLDRGEAGRTGMHPNAFD
jgi:2,5-diketo-D-gluconate reductase A